MKNRKIKSFICILSLFLLMGITGCGSNDNDAQSLVTVVEAQDNAFDSYSYNDKESYTFSFIKAPEDGVTYELKSQKNEKFENVDYFSLVAEDGNFIKVEKGTDAGKYTLVIRAYSANKKKYKDITYIFTIDKVESEYKVEPSAKQDLVYNGNDQILVNEGETEFGEIQYKLDDGEYSTDLPKAKDAGIYTVSYKLVGDNNHSDIEEKSFVVTIDRKKVSYVSPSITFTLGKTDIYNDLIDYVNDKADQINNRTDVNGKPKTYVEYTYDGQVHTNGYNKPDGVDIVGFDSGIAAGRYYATYVPDYNHCWNDGTRDAVTVELRIKKKALTIPTVIDDLTYNGKTQEAKLDNFDSELEYVLNNRGKKAGEYTLVVGLKDKINYCWSDNTWKDKEISWHISVKKVNVPYVETVYTYKTVLNIPVYQFVTYRDLSDADSSLIKIESGNTGVYAGDYELVLSLRDKENYEWNDEIGGNDIRFVPWTINRKSVGDKPVDKEVTYNGLVNYNGYVKPLHVSYTGNTFGVNAGEYYAYYTPDDNYCWSDETYDIVDVTLTINKADSVFKKEAVGIEGLVYDGNIKKLIAEASSENGEILYKINDSEFEVENFYATDAGTYNISYYIKGDQNHYDSEIKSVTVTIAKATPTVLVEPTTNNYKYDGSEKALVNEGVVTGGEFNYVLDGVTYTSAADVVATNAGTYEIEVTVKGNRNYEDLEVGTITATIYESDKTIYVEEPEAISRTYNGQYEPLVTSGSTNDGTIMYRVNNGEFSSEVPTEMEVGKYTVTYYIKGDDNHEDSAYKSVNVEITNAEFIVSVTSQQVYDYTGQLFGEPVEVVTADGKPATITYTCDGVTYENGDYPKFANVKYMLVSRIAIPREISYTVEAYGHNTQKGKYTILINKANPVPDFNSIHTYSGGPQDLVDEIDVNGGHIEFSKYKYHSYGSTVPQKTDVGQYTLYYRIFGDNNHNDVGPTQIYAYIDNAYFEIEDPDQLYEYDGEYHGDPITVKAEHTDDYTVLYRTLNGEYSSTVPQIMEKNRSVTVYYQVSADNYHTEEGSYTLSIISTKPEYPNLEINDIDDITLEPEQEITRLITTDSNGELECECDNEKVECWIDDNNYLHIKVLEDCEQQWAFITVKVSGGDYYSDSICFYVDINVKHDEDDPGEDEPVIDYSIKFPEDDDHILALDEVIKYVKIETNYEGTLTCSSNNPAIGCDITADNYLKIVVLKEPMTFTAKITVRAEIDEYYSEEDDYEVKLVYHRSATDETDTDTDDETDTDQGEESIINQGLISFDDDGDSVFVVTDITKTIQIVTDLEGTLSCESHNEAIGCAIDDNNNLVLSLVGMPLNLNGSVTVSITNEEEVIAQDDYKFEIALYREDDENNSVELESEQLDEEKHELNLNETNIESLDLNETNTENEVKDDAYNVETTTDNTNVTTYFNNQIKDGANVHEIDISSQTDGNGNPVSYFSIKDGVITANDSIPAGTYVVDANVRIVWIITEDGNAKAVVLSEDNLTNNVQTTTNNQEVVDSGSNLETPSEYYVADELVDDTNTETTPSEEDDKKDEEEAVEQVFEEPVADIKHDDPSEDNGNNDDNGDGNNNDGVVPVTNSNTNIYYKKDDNDVNVVEGDGNE